MTMKATLSVESHLKEMKDITDQLAALGSPISEEDQVITLLGSLPPKFSTLVTALEARSTELSIGYIQQGLQHEEQKLKSMHEYGGAGVSESALTELPRRLCYGCGKPGHIKRYCPNKFNRTKSMLSHNAKVINLNEDDGSRECEMDNLCFSAAYTGVDCNNESQWIVDSGASRHMSHDKIIFQKYQNFEVPETVGLGDGKSAHVYGSGQILIKMKIDGGERCVDAKICDALFVPKLNCNLFSVRAAVSNGNTLPFNNNGCYIFNKQQQLLGEGILNGKLYRLLCDVYEWDKSLLTVSIEKVSSVHSWHQRLGHLNAKHLKTAISSLSTVNDDALNFCEVVYKEKCTSCQLNQVLIQ